MRNIPGLSADIANRATTLAAKARDARKAAPGTVPPVNSIAPAKVTDGVATLRLYDYIDGDGGYWGISADELAEALDNIEGTVERIDLRINSGGGAVWDGLAILNQLRTREEPIRAIVDGVAASAASFIAVACDEVVMMPNSRMMIHNAMGICFGQAVDMREYAAFLEDSSRNIAEIYADRSGKPTDEWCTLMDSVAMIGQWYSAQEAVDAGLADSVWESAKSTDEPDDKAPVAKSAEDEPTSPGLDQAPKLASLKARNLAARNRLAAQRHGISA
jgi:ATP-dependent protease ClpP protease subunit